MGKQLTKKKIAEAKQHEIEGLEIDIDLTSKALDREKELWDMEEICYLKELEYEYKFDENGVFLHWKDPDYVKAKKYLLNAIYVDKRETRIGKRQYREDQIAKQRKQLAELKGE